MWAKMGICGRVLDKYTDLDFISGISKKNNNAYSADYNTAQQITWELSKVILGPLWGFRHSLPRTSEGHKNIKQTENIRS